MNYKLIIHFIFLAFYHFTSFSQDIEIAKIKLDAGDYDRINTLVRASLDGLDIKLEAGSLV